MTERRSWWYPTLALIWLGVIMAVVSCTNPTANEQKTEGEWIREALVTDGDAVLALSTNWMANQVGTNSFLRTVDSVHRGFVGTRFFTDTIEKEGSTQAFDAAVYDTVWGSLSFRVGTSLIPYRYSRLLYAGKVKLLRLGSNVTHPNPWWLWRMEYRFGNQPGMFGPIIEQVTVTAGGGTENMYPRKLARLVRDSVLTVLPDVLVDVTVTVKTSGSDDSFFVSYPRDGIFMTQPMAHNDTLHTATVQVRSGARFDVIGVQGFKRRSFESASVSGAQATSIQTTLIRFYQP